MLAQKNQSSFHVACLVIFFGKPTQLSCINLDFVTSFNQAGAISGPCDLRMAWGRESSLEAADILVVAHLA